MVVWVCAGMMVNGLHAEIPPEVASALNRSGANRASLEKVLKDYDTKKTREKFEAACFLITHMQWHSRAGEVLAYDPRLDSAWTAAAAVYENLTRGQVWTSQDRPPLRKTLNDTATVMNKYMQHLRLSSPSVHPADLPDISTLDGDFVRSQVEHAFRLRERSPWAGRLSFGDFCEYVLPYRAIGSYPLISNPVRMDSLFSTHLRADTAGNLVDVAARYNRFIPWMRRTGGRYPFETNCGWPELLFGGFHDCVDVAHYGAMALRSVGVPVAVEYNASYRLWEGRHFMVAVRMPDGRWQPFSPESNLPVPASAKFPGCLNLYRLHFSLQSGSPWNLRAPGEPLPTELSDPCIEDVTESYMPVAHVDFPLSSGFPEGRKLAYLATFRGNEGLLAVTWACVDSVNRRVVFDRVVGDNLYFPVYCDDMGRLRPMGRPFWLAIDSTGDNVSRVDSLPRPSGRWTRVVLRRKFPYKSKLVDEARRMAGVTVIGSDERNFAKADTLARIDSISGPYWADLPLNIRRPYRFYRVCCPKDYRHIHLSELQFLTRRGYGYANTMQPVQPAPYDPADTAIVDTSWVRLMAEPIEKCKWRREYDGNVQTAPDRWPDVTLALKEPQWVHVLRYAPKSAANTVERGHLYRLMRWDERLGWRTEWVRPARHAFLEADMEIGGLYRLTDLTEGREELPFLIGADGRQEFLHVRWSGSGLE